MRTYIQALSTGTESPGYAIDDQKWSTSRHVIEVYKQSFWRNNR